MKKCYLLVVMLVSILALQAFAIPYSETPLTTEANLLPPLRRVSPDDGVLETLPTQVWFWQDEQHLCFVFEAVIDSTFTPGPVSTRDTGNKADYLRIQLITMPDGYYSYLYNFYATGNLYDAVRETGRVDFNFNTGYTYSSSVKGNLWRIEGKIPLGELRFRQELPYRWKVIVTRHHDYLLQDFSLPTVNPKMMNDYFAKAFDIEFSHPIKRHLDIEFRPYFVKSYDLKTNTDSFDPDNLGMDIAMHPAQRTKIKLSLNPDFSDVPPDEAADLYNSKYPRYYFENRFFFTEDIDAFALSMDVFNSRKIIDPDIAFKATGSSTNLKWGVLAAQDNKIVENGYTRNDDDYFQVLSLIPHTKMISLPTALISRMNKDYYNHVLNGYYRYDLSNDIRLMSWNSFSIKDDDRNGASDPLYGSGHNFSLSLTPQNWSIGAYTTYISRNLNADAGYLNERFFHKFGCNLGWDSEETMNYVTNQGFSTTWEYYDYYAKHNTEAALNANYYIYFRPKFNLATSFGIGRLLDMANMEHSTWDASISGVLARWQSFGAQIKYVYADELVYSLADTYGSHSLYGNVWGTLQQVFGYDFGCTYRKYAYRHGELADYGGLLPYPMVLDNAYLIFNGELSYTPHQKLRLACGSGLTTYEESGVFSEMNLYGNLRYEFKPSCFFYAGFNNNQLQDVKFTYNKPLGHFVVDSATAYAKLSLKL